MPPPETDEAQGALWESEARLSVLIRRARGTALIAFPVALIVGLWFSLAIAIVVATVATTSTVIALFAWFRADDLSAGRPRRP